MLCGAQTDEQKEAERAQQGEQLLHRAHAQQATFYDHIQHVERLRALGGICKPPSKLPRGRPHCPDKFLLMRPTFVEGDLYPWSGLGGQLAAIARGVALACATGRTLLLPELSVRPELRYVLWLRWLCELGLISID